MECVLQLRKLCQIETKRMVFLMGFTAISILVVQTLTFPYGNHFSQSFPDGKVLLHESRNFHDGDSSTKSVKGHKLSLSFGSNLTGSPLLPVAVTFINPSNEGVRKTEFGSKIEGGEDVLKFDSEFESLTELEYNGKSVGISSVKKASGLKKMSLKTNTFLRKFKESKQENSILNSKERETYSSIGISQLQSASNKSRMKGNRTKKVSRWNLPPKTRMSIAEMDKELFRRRSSYHSPKPQWSSPRDRELLFVKSKIENAHYTNADINLHAPLFRNITTFSRSYELMERTLKVYIYKDGEKPIFHLPLLKGIYASEGWFMKLMQESTRFLVKDPKKAHMFYMPFSTRMLEFSLYVRNSHDRTNLAQYLKNYTNIIASKYSFWNRTGGADHFFAACHDWAPYETRHHMERCIKAMCNSDHTVGFKVGKDVSLPETYVRSAKNPQRDIGGKPSSERSILAFFAGSMHGYLRPILLSFWENKDPDMKIFSRMPLGVAGKMNYIYHMKSSKYCVCAKGFNVNSPRVVEAIFYECVPVIISDNFVPPFFEVLDWPAFAVFVLEKDIPNLKEILLSISDEKYQTMQMNVKRVQQHFLWHSKPEKYDLFHMTLHSIWYNRLYQIRPR